MSNWIKLHRKILDNPIFQNAELFQLYSFCLLRAGYEEKEVFEGSDIIKLSKGQFVTGRLKLSDALGQNPSTIYKRLKKLEKLGYIELKSNNKNTLVTVVNWESYQCKDEKVTTNEQQSNNKVTTKEQQSNTNKNIKNNKNKRSIVNRHKYGEYQNVLLNDTEFDNLVKDYGEVKANELIRKLDEGIEMKGYKYKNYNLAIRNWANKDGIKKINQPVKANKKRDFEIIYKDRE